MDALGWDRQFLYVVVCGWLGRSEPANLLIRTVALGGIGVDVLKVEGVIVGDLVRHGEVHQLVALMNCAFGGLPDDWPVQLEVEVAALVGLPELALLRIRGQYLEGRLLQPVPMTLCAHQGSRIQRNELPMRVRWPRAARLEPLRQEEAARRPSATWASSRDSTYARTTIACSSAGPAGAAS